MTAFILAIVIIFLIKVIFEKEKTIEKQRNLVEDVLTQNTKLKNDATTRSKQSR